MHNITKIKLFRILLRITYLPSLIFLYPLALLRKKSETGLFFFFDRYSMGGAQRVHLDILRSVEKIDKTVFFTRKSPDELFKKEFEQVSNSSMRYIEKYCDFLFIRLFSVHYFSFYINRHKSARVLSSNSTFFYDMLPFLKKNVLTIELLHNFSFGKKGMEFFGLLNHRYLSWRLSIDNATRNHIIRQYAEYQIPDLYLDRLRTIEFGVDIPEHCPVKSKSPLQIFYSGRGGPQKRIYLINKIAVHFITSKAPVQFHFAGNIENELSEIVVKHSIVYGSVADQATMQKIYADCHLLLMTSAYEGFPVVIKEAMANGCVPVVTALPGILTHLTDSQNGFLIQSITIEEKVVTEGIEKIEYALKNKQVLDLMSNTCFEYAKNNFSKKAFFQSYAKLLS